MAQQASEIQFVHLHLFSGGWSTGGGELNRELIITGAHDWNHDVWSQKI